MHSRPTCVGLLLALSLGTASHAGQKSNLAPLPKRILEAKTVFIENQSDYAAVADQAHEVLAKWGRFRVVNEKAAADIILVLTTEQSEHIATTPGVSVADTSGNTTIITGGSRIYSYAGGSTRLVILDGKTNERLWADTKPWSRKGASRELFQDLRKRVEQQKAPKR